MTSLDQLRQDAVAWVAGWLDPITGQGDPARDKRAGLMWGGGVPMRSETLASLFAYNDLAHVIVTALPEWGLRHGWDLALGERNAVDAQRVESEVRKQLDQLRAHEVQREGATWGQLYGGGLVLIGAADGQATDQPLDVDALERVEFLRAVERTHVRVAELHDDPAGGDFGTPRVYQVEERTPVGTTATRWHASRVLRYPGALTPERVRRHNRGWDLSVLDRVAAKLSLHDSLWDNVGAMVADGSQGVWKIKGLFNAVVSGRRDQLESRFAIADRTRSLFRSLLLDADSEDFSYVHRQFSGIAPLLAQSAIRTAAAAQMPVTVLFGQSPAGLNATGESDIRLWYDRVESYQEDVLRPRLERLVTLILRSSAGPTKGQAPEHWKVNFRPVRKATPMEEAELRARQAQIDNAYVSARVLSAEEVAVSRFTSEGWSAETQIDLKRRRAAIEAGATSTPAEGEDGGVS